MPPNRKFQREDIVNVAYEIVEREGIGAVNARRIAKELCCSVQPIFHNFSNMEELKTCVYEKIYEQYKSYMLVEKPTKQAYKQMGLSYIQFAKDYPEFFKILFMQSTDCTAVDFIMNDVVGENVIQSGQALTGLSYEEQKKFHVKVWIFTHGIACLVATRTINFTNDELDDLLGGTVLEILKGYKEVN